VSNWIDDGHGNKWHRCKLGPDCGLKVIEAGRARCWCQDQEASRCEVQGAREEIRSLKDDNERLREEAQRAKVDRDLAGWDDYAVIAELKRENAALRADNARLDWLERRTVSRLQAVLDHVELHKLPIREAIDLAIEEIGQ
jgi:hypothetical protein